MKVVETSAIAAQLAGMVLGIGTPAALFIYFRNKYRISWKPFLLGLLTFFLFVQVLEAAFHGYFLYANEWTKEWLKNPWLYMLYGGLAAGIFEETGRLVMMKFALKSRRDWKDGLSFGLGHGGFEALWILGVNGVVLLSLSFFINSGSFDSLTDGQLKEALRPLRDQLVNGSPWLFLLAGLERIGAVLVHIGLSLVVLYAVKSGQLKFYWFAVLLHAIFDFPAALYQSGVIADIWLVEIFVAGVAVLSVAWIIKAKPLFERAEA
ncbi:YhfC family intramembrane metalloprotease [Caldibacillus debilis]|jgi:uncharacterized membrane protein YhfC|uniref:YhfC family intramembrane metalloprotease n=1 Tax=Caldibacillus debilis TaxID=301148 RepID=UPI000EAA6377|nr:YhfC family intramembrane metalloprotease [Caldibacillus debilis]